MGWRGRFAVLLAAAVPSLTGWPLARFDTPVVSGLSEGWLAYMLAINMLAALCCGRRRYADILAMAALITTPVVYGGAAVAWVWTMAAGTAANHEGAHYLKLCANMLTVVPLALALVAQVPFQYIEQGLLEDGRGVGRRQKTLMIILRVFTHIVYFVIPNILEVVREERFGAHTDTAVPRARWARLKRLLIDLSVEAICASIRYIPLWAVEIAALPEPEAGTAKQDDSSNASTFGGRTGK
jgi:hypothetical protein